MRKVLSQIWRGTKRPVEAFNYFVRVMKRHNMLTEASRVRHRGERVVVTDFEAAGVKKNDPVVLQHLNRYQWVLSKVKASIPLTLDADPVTGPITLRRRGPRRSRVWISPPWQLTGATLISRRTTCATGRWMSAISSSATGPSKR